MAQPLRKVKQAFWEYWNREAIVDCLVSKVKTATWWTAWRPDHTSKSGVTTHLYRHLMDGIDLPSAETRKEQRAQEAAARAKEQEKEAALKAADEGRKAKKEAKLKDAGKLKSAGLHIVHGSDTAVRKLARGTKVVGHGLGKGTVAVLKSPLTAYRAIAGWIDKARKKKITWQEIFLRLLSEQSVDEFSQESILFLIEAKELMAMEEGEPKRQKMIHILKMYVDSEGRWCINVSHKARHGLTKFASTAGEPDPDEDHWFKRQATGSTDWTPVPEGELDAAWNLAIREDAKLISDMYARLIRYDRQSFEDLMKGYRSEILPFAEDCRDASSTGAHSMHYGSFLDQSIIDSDDSHRDYAHSYAFGDYANFEDYDPIYSHRSPLNGGYYRNEKRMDYAHSHTYDGDSYGLIVGGLFGGVATVFVMIVFCIGLAFGMMCCWAYMQRKVLEKGKDREVHWKANEEENDSHL